MDSTKERAIASRWQHANSLSSMNNTIERGSDLQPATSPRDTGHGASTRTGARPSRNNKRTSYSDYYNIGLAKGASGAKMPETKRTNVLKLKFNSPNHRVSNTKSSPADLGSPNLQKSNVMARIAEADNLRLDVAQLPPPVSVTADTEIINATAEHRERAMTSPLSSVPSNLDEDEGSAIGAEHSPAESFLVIQRTSLHNDTKGQSLSEMSSGTRKRSAPSNHIWEGEKKTSKNKKVKICSPAKQKTDSLLALGVLPQDSRNRLKVDADNRARGRDTDLGSNDGHCAACSGTGKLLCCDDCPKSFHLTCIEPPIEEADIPDEPFFCMACWDKRYSFPSPGPGLFHELLVAEITRDPTMFQLPSNIKTFFGEVTTGENGVYQETKDQKFLRKDRNGFAEDIDPYRLRDRQNKPILCYRCGESAIGSAGIVSCDYCSSHWHFDCVVPPLHGPPSSYRKWMCPLHTDDLTPSIRRLKQSRTLDVSLKRGFNNDGNIDVLVSEEEPDPASDSDTGSENQSDCTPMANLSNIRYRLPAKGIILDFLDTCHQELEIEGTQLLDTIVPDQTYQSLALLVDVAMGEAHALAQPASSSAQEERLQLLAIKALLSVKGKEKLLEFLRS